MLLKKKEKGIVLFDPTRALEFRRALHEKVYQAVKPRIDAINRQLREDRTHLDEYRI